MIWPLENGLSFFNPLQTTLSVSSILFAIKEKDNLFERYSCQSRVFICLIHFGYISSVFSRISLIILRCCNVSCGTFPWLQRFRIIRIRGGISFKFLTTSQLIASSVWKSTLSAPLKPPEPATVSRKTLQYPYGGPQSLNRFNAKISSKSF